jgi:uncharacterized protein
MENKILNHIYEAGFPKDLHLIHAFLGGSALHGARMEGKADLDIYGVFIEPPTRLIGLDKHEHFVHNTSDETRRNTPDDVDICAYGLRRWAELAIKGNPTALNFLFAHNYVMHTDSMAALEWGSFAAQARKAILAKSASKQFMDFADAQLGRLLGTRGAGKHGQRLELTANHGYDTKAGMHVVRLLNEAIELMRQQEMTFPCPEVDTLLEIRRGEWSLDRLSKHVNGLFTELKDAVERSKLPERPDRETVNALLVKTYQSCWGEMLLNDIKKKGGTFSYEPIGY